jgi:hypothetical protein
MIPTTNRARFEHLIGLARDVEKNAHRYGAPKKYKALQLAAAYRDMAFEAIQSRRGARHAACRHAPRGEPRRYHDARIPRRLRYRRRSDLPPCRRRQPTRAGPFDLLPPLMD